MNIISFESIISALLLLGFDEVDSSLFNYALDIISMGEDFELGKKSNYLLSDIITRERNIFRLKENITLNGSIIVNNKVVPVKKILEYNTNNLLLEYLDNMKSESHSKKMK